MIEELRAALSVKGDECAAAQSALAMRGDATVGTLGTLEGGFCSAAPEKLGLGGNNAIGPIGASARGGPENNATLTRLEFYGNNIGAQGARARARGGRGQQRDAYDA